VTEPGFHAKGFREDPDRFGVAPATRRFLPARLSRARPDRLYYLLVIFPSRCPRCCAVRGREVSVLGRRLLAVFSGAENRAAKQLDFLRADADRLSRNSRNRFLELPKKTNAKLKSWPNSASLYPCKGRFSHSPPIQGESESNA